MRFNGFPYINKKGTYEVLEDGKVIEKFRLKGTANYWVMEREKKYPERNYKIIKSVTTKNK